MERLTQYDEIRKIYRIKPNCSQGEHIQRLGKFEDYVEKYGINIFDETPQQEQTSLNSINTGDVVINLPDTVFYVHEINSVERTLTLVDIDLNHISSTFEEFSQIPFVTCGHCQSLEDFEAIQKMSDKTWQILIDGVIYRLSHLDTIPEDLCDFIFNYICWFSKKEMTVVEELVRQKDSPCFANFYEVILARIDLAKTYINSKTSYNP